MANEEGEEENGGDGDGCDTRPLACCELDAGAEDCDGDATREKNSEWIWLGRFSLSSLRALFLRCGPRWLALEAAPFLVRRTAAVGADWDDGASPSERVSGKHAERLAVGSDDAIGESWMGERAGVHWESPALADSCC
jgi:hypothetical protein